MTTLDRMATVDEEAQQRIWWQRALAVLVAPTPVFAALREDEDASMEARQEPVLALMLLAGIAGVLNTSVAGRLLDDPTYTGLLVAVWAFIGGLFYGVAVYWLGGAALYIAGQVLGSLGSYRRARHVLGFAAAPVALSLLLLWPVRIAVLGGDLFRSGGSDSGTTGAVFSWLCLSPFVWTLALLVVGVRAVHGWTWGRAAATTALASAIPALLVAASVAR